MAEDSSSESSAEFHDVRECPLSSTPLPPSPQKKRRFKALSLRRKKSSSSDLSTRSEPKKRKGSLTRLLSFGRKKKVEVDSKLSESQDTLSETYEVESPVKSVIVVPKEASKTDVDRVPELRLPQDDSTDSFKSAESPELCNESRDRAVDATRRGWPHLTDSNQCLTETSFQVFAESEFVKELTEAKPKKKFTWRRLLKVHSSVDMSQNTGAIRKERVRGRGSLTARKQETPEKEESVPVTPEVEKKEEPSPPVSEVKKDEGKRVSGDDLRRQLSEGLKNGAGKPTATKAQLSEITQGAIKSGAEETKTYLKTERKKADDEVDNPVSPPEKGDVPSDKNEETPQPSTSGGGGVDLPPTEGKKEHLYKILVIGELGTGKTSIIKRYVHQFFSQHYRATIGVDFALKVLNWDDNSIVRLQLWDIAGQERFGNMTRVYYKEAVGAFIVFDVTRAATFDAVNKWKCDLDSKVQLSDGSPIPCVLLANKCDQPKEGLVNSKNKMDEYCKENGFSGWFETSAKENINIEEAAKALVVKILQNDKLIRTGERGQDADRIDLNGSAEVSSGKSCTC